MTGRLVFVLALTCGIAVGNLYFPQVVSPLVASGLGVSPTAAALVVTVAQLGYAVGIFFLVPLGDRVPYRTLVVALLGLTSVFLLVAGTATSLPALVVGGGLAGVTTVVAPLVAPMVAGMVAPERRGAVTGTVLSGSIGGMLLSRAFGGVLGEWLGWRALYLLAAGLCAVAAVVLARLLPSSEAPSRQRYPALVAESVRLLWAEAALRRSCLNQACVFGGFSAVWTAVALLLTGGRYGLDARAVGALALVNAVTMLCTPVAGRFADRWGPDAVNAVCFGAVLVAAAVLALGGLGGVAGLGAVVAGTLLLDVAMQSGMVANQVRIFALGPQVRSRLNTAYMTCAFLGGAAGSWAATALPGWPWVCALVAALAAVAWLSAARRRGRAPAERR
ncbi:MFS transporter [Actinokineospora sp. PR83]|uniref:MFS transporter n=1 Tax=Actinokineospora sp. PR83 TaxID=2884908 RepID=UPI001F2AEEB4|nr:MFS transporter [Actinokineospora sp. PR83]MCG8917418.1 MFS transporter [Actinokineospora sp. PR83]